MGRSRAASSSNPVPDDVYDETKFVGIKAQNFFTKYGHKNSNVEKEFRKEDLGLDDLFEMYKLDKLAAQPKEKGISVYVKEFYANAFERGNSGKSFVRGKEIDYTSAKINAFYGMSDEYAKDRCEFARIDKLMQWSPLNNLHHLTATFGEFDPSVFKNGRIMFVRDLCPRMRFVHRFICERILPSTHLNEVHWRRAVLMHCMLSGACLNIGRIIQDEIHTTIRNISSCNYNFPCLITALVGKAKASLLRAPRDLIPGTAVDKKFLLRGIKQDEGTSQGDVQMEDVNANAGEENEGRAPEEENRPGDHGPVGWNWERVDERFGQVDGRFDRMDVRFDRVDERQFLDNYQNSMWQDRMEDMYREQMAMQQAFQQEVLQRLPPPRPFEPYVAPQNLVWDGPTWDDVRDQQRQEQPGPSFDQGASSSAQDAWDSMFGPSPFGPQ